MLRRPVEPASIKGEVKKKYIFFAWNFSCFSAHLIRARSVLTYRAMCSVAGNLTPWIGFSLPVIFITSSRRSLSVPESAKQNVVNFGDHSSIWDSWPVALSGCPRKPRVGSRLRCPRHAASNLPAETRSRTRVSRQNTQSLRRGHPRWSPNRNQLLYGSLSTSGL
jgi:hypothetical protein